MVKKYLRKDLLATGVKKFYKIPIYLYGRYVKKRIPFSIREVTTTFPPELSYKIYMHVKALEKAIKNFHAKRSLEIGCGYGRLTPWISEYSDEAYAIEPEFKLLKHAQRLYPHVRFYKTTVQNLPFPNNYFELCVTWTVLQHIMPEELPQAVEEIKRVMSSEGIIILAEVTDEEKEVPFATWSHSIKNMKNYSHLGA